jgi:nucleoside 2-deoxyribosyltransferase
MKEFKVFIAGWFEARGVMTELASLLTDEGFTVTSRWINTPKGVSDFYGLHENTIRIHAAKDIEDLNAANLVILVNPKRHHGKGRGGRHWEVGYAYGRGKPIIIVGEPENLYHYLHDVHRFSTTTPIGDFMNLVKRLRGEDDGDQPGA